MLRLSFVLRSVAALSALTVTLGLLAAPVPARAELVPAYGPAAGPEKARGAIVWSHGRSIASEDSLAPTPPYLRSLRDAGWDVYRFNRLRDGDTLTASGRALAGHAEDLSRSGYRRVVAAGHSFGAFLSLIAAGRTDAIDAVVGTAPAAYGSYSESYSTFRKNASQLWPLLGDVRSARVLLFFFHGDDFDPGGRGDAAQALLDRKGTGHLVIDQPAGLTGHGAANTGLFVRRFGTCIRRFADGDPQLTASRCEDPWGSSPSADVLAAAPGGRSGSAPTPLRPYLGRWYGVYTSGREIVLSFRASDDGGVIAEGMLGPGLDSAVAGERISRSGRLDRGVLVFDEPGRQRLGYRLSPNGALIAEAEAGARIPLRRIP